MRAVRLGWVLLLLLVSQEAIAVHTTTSTFSQLREDGPSSLQMQDPSTPSGVARLRDMLIAQPPASEATEENNTPPPSGLQQLLRKAKEFVRSGGLRRLMQTATGPDLTPNGGEGVVWVLRGAGVVLLVATLIVIGLGEGLWPFFNYSRWEVLSFLPPGMVLVMSHLILYGWDGKEINAEFPTDQVAGTPIRTYVEGENTTAIYIAELVPAILFVIVLVGTLGLLADVFRRVSSRVRLRALLTGVVCNTVSTALILASVHTWLPNPDPTPHSTVPTPDIVGPRKTLLWFMCFAVMIMSGFLSMSLYKLSIAQGRRAPFGAALYVGRVLAMMALTMIVQISLVDISADVLLKLMTVLILMAIFIDMLSLFLFLVDADPITHGEITSSWMLGRSFQYITFHATVVFGAVLFIVLTIATTVTRTSKFKTSFLPWILGLIVMFLSVLLPYFTWATHHDSPISRLQITPYDYDLLTDKRPRNPVRSINAKLQHTSSPGTSSEETYPIRITYPFHFIADARGKNPSMHLDLDLRAASFRCEAFSRLDPVTDGEQAYDISECPDLFYDHMKNAWLSPTTIMEMMCLTDVDPPVDIEQRAFHAETLLRNWIAECEVEIHTRAATPKSGTFPDWTSVAGHLASVFFMLNSINWGDVYENVFTQPQRSHQSSVIVAWVFFAFAICLWVYTYRSVIVDTTLDGDLTPSFLIALRFMLLLCTIIPSVVSPHAATLGSDSPWLPRIGSLEGAEGRKFVNIAVIAVLIVLPNCMHMYRDDTSGLAISFMDILKTRDLHFSAFRRAMQRVIHVSSPGVTRAIGRIQAIEACGSCSIPAIEKSEREHGPCLKLCTEMRLNPLAILYSSIVKPAINPTDLIDLDRKYTCTKRGSDVVKTEWCSDELPEPEDLPTRAYECFSLQMDPPAKTLVDSTPENPPRECLPLLAMPQDPDPSKLEGRLNDPDSPTEFKVLLPSDWSPAASGDVAAILKDKSAVTAELLVKWLDQSLSAIPEHGRLCTLNPNDRCPDLFSVKAEESCPDGYLEDDRDSNVPPTLTCVNNHGLLKTSLAKALLLCSHFDQCDRIVEIVTRHDGISETFYLLYKIVNKSVVKRPSFERDETETYNVRPEIIAEYGLDMFSTSMAGLSAPVAADLDSFAKVVRAGNLKLNYYPLPPREAKHGWMTWLGLASKSNDWETHKNKCELQGLGRDCPLDECIYSVSPDKKEHSNKEHSCHPLTDIDLAMRNYAAVCTKWSLGSQQKFSSGDSSAVKLNMQRAIVERYKLIRESSEPPPLLHPLTLSPAERLYCRAVELTVGKAAVRVLEKHYFDAETILKRNLRVLAMFKNYGNHEQWNQFVNEDMVRGFARILHSMGSDKDLDLAKIFRDTCVFDPLAVGYGDVLTKAEQHSGLEIYPDGAEPRHMIDTPAADEDILETYHLEEQTSVPSRFQLLEETEVEEAATAKRNFDRYVQRIVGRFRAQVGTVNKLVVDDVLLNGEDGPAIRKVLEEKRPSFCTPDGMHSAVRVAIDPTAVAERNFETVILPVIQILVGLGQISYIAGLDE